MGRLKTALLISVVSILLTLVIGLATAQDEIILTVAMPEWMQSAFNEDSVAPFLEAHPGVKVVLVNATTDAYYPASSDLEQHLEGAADYASQADVLLMQSSYMLTPATTRAGYYLDLSPLTAADPDLDTSDFFPAVWEAYQWDNGIWALPISASAIVVMYNADAFDEAGIAYPNERWTLTDFINAATALTQYDDEGNIVVAGTVQSQNGLLLRALLGQTFYDNSTGQVQPRFDTPEAQALLEEWKQFYNDVIANIQFERINFDDIPLMVEQTYRLRNTNEDANWQAALLPGGAAGLDVQAIAVSAGTPHPQLAYELAKFLTSDAEIVNYIYGDTPARRSLVGVEAENSMIRRPDVPEEAQMVIDQAVENGLAASDRLFEDYFSQAASISAIEGTDTQIALQEAEQQAQADLEEATTRGETAVVTVATPVPTPVLSQSEVALRFSINANISPLPNREQWEDLAQEFIAADPQVGHIELTSNLGSQNQEEPDCYYSSFNSLDSMNLAEPTLLSLDPLMNADPNFDRADFIPQVLDQLTREDQIWGLPMTIEPAIIWYTPEAFAEANVPEPETGWTVSQFADALQMIYANNDDFAVFQPPFGTNTYLLMLMAAYGSVPYDHRTMPPTVNFTGEGNIAAMQQVLDLAKEGYIDYQELADMSGGGGSIGGQIPMVGDTLSLQNWRLQFRAQNEEAGVESQRLTTFPVGTEYTPLSYQIGAGYINVGTSYPEACYRWLSFVSQNPTLFTSMPARFSQLNHPDIVTLGDDVVALYQSYADLFSGPDVIVFTPYGAINYFGASIEQIWMNRAFDNYILEDADLESELQLAESNIMTYRDCATGLPELNDPDIPQEEAIALVRQYADCAIGVDPTMEERYSYLDDIE